MKQSLKLKNAILFRDYFMTSWLSVFGWRLLNMIDCRVGTDPERANVFKGPVMGGVGVPAWANPNEEHWQFQFAPSENKASHEPAGFVPRILIADLELYFFRFRPTLLGENGKSNILFLTDHGKQFTRDGFEHWLASRSRRYVSEHITPHAMRRDRSAKLAAAGRSIPEIARVLWQVDLATTAEYIVSFDESDGAVCLDNFLGDVQPGHGLKLSESERTDQLKPTTGEEGPNNLSETSGGDTSKAA